MSKSFEAQYHGTCCTCEEPIKPGQSVRFEGRALEHEDCMDHVVPERPVTICQTCWLAKPCACDD